MYHNIYVLSKDYKKIKNTTESEVVFSKLQRRCNKSICPFEWRVLVPSLLGPPHYI